VQVAWEAGLGGILIVTLGLAARSAGVCLCLLGTNLNARERLFIVAAYTPKATVQAAIGAAPLAAMRMAGMETHAGEVILAVAVLSILFTAPLGAWVLALAGPSLLDPAPPHTPREDLEAVLESEGIEGED
ncbi:MAG: sodium:proton antiporter, partial [Candidatus Hydrogenedentota bacterium]